MKVGIVGYGRRAHYFIEQAIKQKDNIILLSNHFLARQHTEFTVCSGMSDFIGQKPDIGIITSADSQHFEQALVLIKNQIPLLIEKPSSASSEQIEILSAMAQKYKTPVYVGYNYRACPIYQQVKEMQLDLAEVIKVDCYIAADVFKSLTQTDKLFLNVGCHYVDAINQIFNYPSWHICNSIMRKENNREKAGQVSILLNNFVPLSISFNFQAECFPEIFESSIFIQTARNTLVLTRNSLKIIEGKKVKEYNEAQSPIYKAFLQNIKSGKNNYLCTLTEDMLNIQIIENIYGVTTYTGEV